LAGKRGICPHCSARFRIPEESEIPKGAPKLRPDLPDVDPARGTRDAPAVIAAGAAVAQAAPQVDTFTDPLPEPSRPANGNHTDPIAEAPNAVWYVRPPSGGEYGPAQPDVMRRWLDEGRVSADTLVWREGWPEWQVAGPLFPSLSAASSVPAPTETQESTFIDVETEDEPRSARRSASNRRRPSSTSTPKSIAIIVTLVLVVISLLVALVFVIQGMP
jgi:hypothetical protein